MRKIFQWPFFVFLAIFVANIFFYVGNKSWLFDFNTLNLYGDQRLYVDLSNNIANFVFLPHVYSIGFPILLLPFLFFLKTADWIVVSKYVIIFQALFAVPFTWLLLTNLFRKISVLSLKKKGLLLTAIPIIFVAYELFVLRTSKDPVVFHLFFGLIPYSEPLAILFLTLVYFLLIKNKFLPNRKIIFLLGFLASFLLSIRIIFLFLLVPIFLFSLALLYRRKIGQFVLFLSGALIGYLPQIIYNNKAYHRIFYFGYDWYWQEIYPKYKETIHDLYGQYFSSQFHFQYFKVNVFALWNHYIHFVLLANLNIVIIFFRRKRLRDLGAIDFFFIASNLCALLYTAAYLAYWWSLSVDCIDRFLMPLAVFSLINFSYSVKLLHEKNS